MENSLKEPVQNISREEMIFDEFYSEVKAIEKRDSFLTSEKQIERLTRPGSTYFNLNPFEVLQIDPDMPLNEIKQKYKRMSILVHPDKNLDDPVGAQKSFDAVNKAYKTLENEEGYKRCKEIVEEARNRVVEDIKAKKKQLKKEGKPVDDEDNQDKLKYKIYATTCKLFADLEKLRQQQETKDAHEKKRKVIEEAEEQERKKAKAEWDKNYEESRTERVDSWRGWNKTGKKAKGTFRPPKPKMEQR